MGYALLWILAARTTTAQPQVWIERVEPLGHDRTQPQTLLELLPRSPPAHYTQHELAEFQRRIENLEIFDEVELEPLGSTLQVRVREKWTLIPSFDLSTGSSLADLYLSIGATEYNTLGRAAQLGASVVYQQRGWGFFATFQEHEYRPQRWAVGFEARYGTYSQLFERSDGSDGWDVTGPSGSVWFTSPPLFSPNFRYQLGVFYGHESVTPFEGEAPPSGHAVQVYSTVIFDQYSWDDLVPSGLRASCSLGPGLFLPASQPRHFAECTLHAALPLARYTVLMARADGRTTSRGNANSSYLLGSYEGVRGLDDTRHHSWLQGFVNVELRQSLRLAERWALQFVLFADTGAAAEIDARGQKNGAMQALSTGAGIRVVPTFLASLVLRFDVARLHVPESLWFHQFGVSQYF